MNTYVADQCIPNSDLQSSANDATIDSLEARAELLNQRAMRCFRQAAHVRTQTEYSKLMRDGNAAIREAERLNHRAYALAR